MPVQFIPFNDMPPPPPMPLNNKSKQSLISSFITQKSTNNNTNINNTNSIAVKPEPNKSTETTSSDDIDLLTNTMTELTFTPSITANQLSTDNELSTNHLPKCISQTTWQYIVDTDTYQIINKDIDSPAFNPTQYKPYYLPSCIYNELYTYQQYCLQWLYCVSCERIKNKNCSYGCILGDDMGLGKTVQISAYLSGLFYSKLVKRVLLVVPVAVTEQWYTHLTKWSTVNGKSHLRIRRFNEGSRKVRSGSLQDIIDRGGVCITTYGLLQSCDIEFIHCIDSGGKQYQWDYVICDEGHTLKNSATKISQTLRLVPSIHRCLITGTPLQNHLDELWSLYDYVSHSTLFGTRAEFKLKYESIILHGHDKYANIASKSASDRISHHLRTLYQPYFLRREKNDVGIGYNIQKNDFIIWLYLSELQSKLYTAFSESDDVRQLLNTSKSPLAALKVLQKICDHPRLLKAELDQLESVSELINFQQETIQNTIDESGKLSICIQLVQQLVNTSHRILVFASSLKILNLIQNILTSLNITYTRIDGSITGAERANRIQQFNSDQTNVFLLTTGGMYIIQSRSYNPIQLLYSVIY